MNPRSFDITVRDERGEAVLEFDQRGSVLHIAVPDGRYVLTVSSARRRLATVRVLLQNGCIARVLEC
jgi:hypothetical protein